jgi:hypothetical protein
MPSQHDRPTPRSRIGSGDRKASVKRSPTLWLSRSCRGPSIRRPRKSIRIRLAANLGDALERAIALTIAEHLSIQSGQHVSLLDLVGYVLYVWSDRPIQIPWDLAQSLQADHPLQGWLVQERSHQPELSGELLAKAGVRLELAVG